MKGRILFFFLLTLPLAAQSVSEIVTLTRQGRLQEARDVLRSLEESEGKKHLFLHGLLTTDGDSAAAFYDNLLNTDPDNPYSDLALFRLAQLTYARGLYHQSMDQFRVLIYRYPSSTLHARAIYQMGMCHSALNQPDSAMAYFQKVREDYPHSDMVSLAGDDMSRIRRQNSRDSEEPEPSMRHCVQVGAFTRQSNALLRKSFFENKGYEVSLRTKTVENRLFYLVWIGSYSSREDARKAGEQLKRKFDIQYTLVSEERR